MPLSFRGLLSKQKRSADASRRRRPTKTAAAILMM